MSFEVFMFETILNEIKAFDTVILHRHSRPDGDAMGSQIGMKHLLLENFPEKKVYAVGDEAGFLSFTDTTATLIYYMPNGLITKHGTYSYCFYNRDDVILYYGTKYI